MNRLEKIIRQHAAPLEPLPTGVEPQLNRLAGIKAVLFDIYGTLFISGSGDVGTATATNRAEALEQALKAAGFKGDLKQAGSVGIRLLEAKILEAHANARSAGTDFPEVDIIAIWKQVTADLMTEEILSGRAGEGRLRQLAVEYECRVNPVYPMPENAQTIQLLREKNLTLGIVSNAQFYTPLLFRAFFRQSVKETGFDPGGCIWSYEELQAKPSADLFPKAGRYLKDTYAIGLHETAYVGNDMLNDIYCAGQAGCRTVLFAGDRRSLRLRENDERCLAVQPDAVITSLLQLMEIL